MSRNRHTEAQIIGALKQLEAGRRAEDVAREVENHGEGDGSAHSPRRKQDKSRDDCPGDGTQRVDPIHVTDAHPQFGRIPHHDTNQNGERAPHQEGWNEQNRGRTKESQREQKRCRVGSSGKRRYIKPTYTRQTGKGEGTRRSN